MASRFVVCYLANNAIRSHCRACHQMSDSQSGFGPINTATRPPMQQWQSPAPATIHGRLQATQDQDYRANREVIANMPCRRHRPPDQAGSDSLEQTYVDIGRRPGKFGMRLQPCASGLSRRMADLRVPAAFTDTRPIPATISSCPTAPTPPALAVAPPAAPSTPCAPPHGWIGRPQRPGPASSGRCPRPGPIRRSPGTRPARSVCGRR